MTLFLSAQIFSVFVLSYGCRAVRLGSRASPSGVQMGIPRLGEDRTGCEKTVRGSKWHRGACLGRARPHFYLRRATLRPHFVLFPFFFLSGPHFAPSYSFTHILLSRTPIDEPFSPTRSTSKHLSILTIFFSFKR